MDSSLILTLVGLIALDIQSFYFGFLRPPRVLAWLQQASFVMLTFLLIPVLIYTLYSQSRAVDRLAFHGIEPHPAISNAVGIANGQGDSPIWVFKLQEIDNALDFYRNSSDSMAWKLIDDFGRQLRFTRGDDTLTIVQSGAPDGSTMAYLISKR